MNSPTLHEHGIDADHSDYRAHVCFAEGMIYLYATTDMRELLLTRDYPIFESATSRGYLVPVDDVPNCQRIPVPVKWRTNLSTRVTEESSTTTKRQWSEMLVQRMLERGYVSLPLTATCVNSRDGQLAGHDLRVSLDCSIQVKCDWNGGANGTGNLYIETAERNPTGAH